MSQKWEDSREVVDESQASFLCRERDYVLKTVILRAEYLFELGIGTEKIKFAEVKPFKS
jgi:hypothetical protein